MRSVAIIGAGLAGLTTAYWLRRHGLAVTIVDSRAGPGEGTSFANGGMLTPSQANPWNSPGVLTHLLGWIGREDSPLLIRPAALPGLLTWGMKFLVESMPRRYRRNTAANLALGRYSLDMHKQLVAATGVVFDRDRRGTLQIFRSRETFEASAAIAMFLVAEGIDAHPLDADAAIELEPSLKTSDYRLAGAIHFPEDETGDAHLFCTALAEQLRADGVMFRNGVEVVSVASEADRVRALVTAGEAIEADAFVVAAGPWSRALVNACSLDWPIYPVKGYSLTCDLAGLNARPRLPIVDMHRKIALTPLGGRLRIAGTAEFAGYDTALNPKRLANILTHAHETLPALKAIPEASFARWTGLRPVTPTGFPMLGRTRLKNLFANAGHGPLGWTFAAGTGKIVADIIATGRHDLAGHDAVEGRIA